MFNLVRNITKSSNAIRRVSSRFCDGRRTFSAMKDLSESEVQKLTSIFNKLDSNKDGYITAVEFGDALKKSFENVSNKMIDEVLAKVPTTSGDKISLEQFLDSVAPAMLVKNMIEGVVQISFDIVDVNNDGKIDKEQTQAMLKMIGQNADNNKIENIMNTYDKDKDGSLTLNDLNDYLWIEVVR